MIDKTQPVQAKALVRQPYSQGADLNDGKQLFERGEEFLMHPLHFARQAAKERVVKAKKKTKVQAKQATKES